MSGKSTKKFSFVYRDDVRYSDCDMHQHMNHAAYFSFFEQARVEFWKHLGLLKSADDFHSIPIIIASAHCDYKAPAYLNDEIAIHLEVVKIGNKSFEIAYEMRNAKTQALLALGSTVQVMYDYDKQKSVPIPETLRKRLTRMVP